LGHKFVFYLNASEISDAAVRFGRAESHHISAVLRLAAGSVVEAVDGEGTLYGVRLEKLQRGSWWGSILRREVQESQAPLPVSLALPCLKGERWEVALEAACEMGIKEVWLTDYHKAVVKWSKGRTERAQRKAIEALKQSGGSRMTRIQGPLALAQLVCETRAGEIWFADADGEVLPVIADAGLFIIGPEAGLDAEELDLLAKFRARRFSLGKRRLRSETAAVAALAQAARMLKKP